MASSGSLNFLEASITGSANIKVDFVGLNTLIVDPLTASSNTLGRGPGVASNAYFNSEIESTLGGTEPNHFNSLMLNRNGPYQHPSWVQYRGGDHPVARTLRLNNTMSIDLKDPDPILRQNNKKIVEFYNEQNDSFPGDGLLDHKKQLASFAKNFPNLKQYYEPAVVSNHKPLVFSMPPQEGTGADYKVRMSLMNHMTFFTNTELNNNLKLASASPITGAMSSFKRGNQNYYEFIHAAKSLGASNFIYSQTIFPKSVNTYRTYKNTLPVYESISGNRPRRGYDLENSRFFWKNAQGGGTRNAVSDGTTRLRTEGGVPDGVFGARNSIGINQDQAMPDMAFVSTVSSNRLLLSQSSHFVTGALTFNHRVNLVSNGIVANALNALTGAVDGNGNVARSWASGAFVQLEAYQPYQTALLSAWPLDPRNDIYDSPSYLTSSIGGKGLQIGLTPHSSTSSIVNTTQATKINNNIANLITRSAGELVYSTKPTIYFFRTGSAQNSVDGYSRTTASLQYNRHTFPYNTPFYATSRIRGRGPMFDSYDAFSEAGDLKFAGRDYSIIPEFRMSENLDFYSKDFNIFKDSEIFESIQKSDYPGGPKSQKIVRRTSINPINPSLKHKLNFLILEGADVSSSSDIASKSTRLPSTDNFVYDDISGPINVPFDQPKHSYTSSSIAVEFYEKYSHTDDLTNFAHLMDQKSRGFMNDVNTIPESITFTCKGIKKLLPYNGFYPVLRTLQIGTAFKNAFGPHLRNHNVESAAGGEVTADQATGTPKALQAVLEPFMAPGVLYNSIKSGIAVDYPIYFRDKDFVNNNLGAQPIYYFPKAWTSRSGPDAMPSSGDTHAERGTDHYVQPEFTSSFNYGGGYMMGSSRCIPAILNNVQTKRVKFENLYDVDSWDKFEAGFIIGQSDFVDVDRWQSIDATKAHNEIGLGSTNGPGYTSAHAGAAVFDPAAHVAWETMPSLIKTKERFIYESTINNFLSETMEFFLEDTAGPGVKLPVITSEPKTGTIDTETDTQYFMEVTLRMGRHQIMCEGPRKAGIGKTKGAGQQGEFPGTRGNNTFTNNSYMRGYIYGPPIEIIPHHSNTTRAPGKTLSSTIIGRINTLDHEDYLGANLQDPAYHSYTPPYFYGASSMIMAYTASSVAQIFFQTTMSDIYAGILSQSFNAEQYLTTSFDGSDLDRLCPMVPTQNTTAVPARLSGSIPRMKIESSVDVFNEVVRIVSNNGNTEYNMMYFAPKWVCPVLDFSSSVAAVDNKVQNLNGTFVGGDISIVTNSYHDHTTGRGLWGGYGTDPYDMAMIEATGGNISEKGIYLEVTDAFRDKYSFGSKQDTDISTGENVLTLGSGRTAGVGTLNPPEMTYTYRTTAAEQAVKTDSLMTKLGFNQQAKPIGRFASNKLVSEAIVLIPYFDLPINIQVDGNSSFEPTGTTPVSGETMIASAVFEQFEVPGAEIYTTREIIPGKHFLPLHPSLFENILSAILVDQYIPDFRKEQFAYSDPATLDAAKNTDVGKLISNLLGDPDEAVTTSLHGRKGYQLPPEFDFIHNRAVKPFQMIVVPMTDALSKQELIDIYQNEMPDSSFDIKKLISKKRVNPRGITDTNAEWFPTGLNVDMSGLGLGGMLSPVPINALNSTESFILKSSIPTWLKTTKDFYSNLKFMTFKVKQRAEKDYKSYRKNQIRKAILNRVSTLSLGNDTEIDATNEFANTLLDRKIKDIYGANWPYDYFSLIQSVKIDVDVEVTD